MINIPGNAFLNTFVKASAAVRQIPIAYQFAYHCFSVDNRQLKITWWVVFSKVICQCVVIYHYGLVFFMFYFLSMTINVVDTSIWNRHFTLAIIALSILRSQLWWLNPWNFGIFNQVWVFILISLNFWWILKRLNCR